MPILVRCWRLFPVFLLYGFASTCLSQPSSPAGPFFNLVPGIDRILPQHEMVDMLSSHAPISKDELAGQIAGQLQYAQAWDASREAVAHMLDNPSTHTHLCITTLEQFIHRYPGEDAAYVLLARAYASMGDMMSASRCNSTAMRITSQHARHWREPSRHPLYMHMPEELRRFMHMQADMLRLDARDAMRHARFLVCQPVRMHVCMHVRGTYVHTHTHTHIYECIKTQCKQINKYMYTCVHKR
jgi:hypothetical protein